MSPVKSSDELISEVEELRDYYKKYCECDSAVGKAECMAGVLRKKLEALIEEVRDLRLKLEKD